MLGMPCRAIPDHHSQFASSGRGRNFPYCAWNISNAINSTSSPPAMRKSSKTSAKRLSFSEILSQALANSGTRSRFWPVPVQQLDSAAEIRTK